MSKLINMERISLKNSSLVKEDIIQEFIKNKELMLEVVKSSIDYYNIND